MGKMWGKYIQVWVALLICTVIVDAQQSQPQQRVRFSSTGQGRRVQPQSKVCKLVNVSSDHIVPNYSRLLART